MIPFAEAKSEIKAIGFDSLRTDSEGYLELVFLKAKLDVYTLKLNNIFGKIAWPSDTPVAEDVKNVIAKYGSVMAGQTLYAMQENSRVMFAMLWPWGDREHITLKMGEKT